MAVMYSTTLAPSKLELIAVWLPSQPWFAGDASALESVGAYRFDDPAGEVGMEGLLLTAGDASVYHVPLTYRAAPLEGGEDFLLGTSEHGVLGTRWFSDAVADPIYRAVLATTIAEGGREADEYVENAEGDRVLREIRTRVRGSGEPRTETPDMRSATIETVGTLTRVDADLAVLDIVRIVDLDAHEKQDQLSLRATWPEQPMPAILALLYSA